MGSLYGANKLGSVGNIVFDKIYSSKTEMDKAMLTDGGDGVFIGRYVLIDYGLRFSEEYNSNAKKDEKQGNYDSTIWQKTENGYRLISELNAPLPEIELKLKAPTAEDDPTATNIVLNPSAPELIPDTDLHYNFYAAPTWGMSFEGAELNSEGFNPKRPNRLEEKGYKSELNAELISSGKVYHNGEKAKDILKLKFNLAGLGDAMSDIWDIVYGTDLDENGNRKQNIHWNNTKGTRMITQNELGHNHYSPENVASVAGAINSVQDLMGQIITTKKPNDITATEKNKKLIYYDENDKQFYIIHKTYGLEEISGDAKYIPNYNISTESLVYEPNTFYYLAENDFYLEDKILPEDLDYYKLQTSPCEKYESGIYYKKISNGSRYELSLEDKPLLESEYVKLYSLQEEVVWYKPGVYVYSLSNDNFFLPAVENNMVSDVVYYEFISGGLETLLNRWPKDTEGNYQPWNFLNDIPSFDVSLVDNLVEFEPNLYYSKVNDYAYDLLTNKPENNSSLVYNLWETKVEFYSFNNYYLSNSNFILEDYDKYDLGKDYYKIDSMKIDEFFIKNYFYEKNGDNYTITLDERPLENKIYYQIAKYSDCFVISDSNNKYPYGFQWVYNSQPPASIVLGVKKPYYEYKLLKGFAKSFNTIHGLIVNINELMEFGDERTRDTSTIQGCINKLNDILIGFNKLQQNSLVIADEYGYPVGKMIKQDSLIKTDILQDEISITHKDTEFKGSTYGINSTYINPGDGIKIPKISMGEKGHIYSIEDSTVYLNNKFPIPVGYDWVNGWFDENGIAYLPAGMNELRAVGYQKILITVHDSISFIFDTWSDGLYQRQSQVFDGVYYSLFLDDTSSTIAMQLQTGSLANGTYSPVSVDYRIRGIK